MLLLAGSGFARADPPRTNLNGPPLIAGQEVREFVLSAPIFVGEKLPPGLPTTITYEMLPNRFVAACEDADGIYYQAVGPFQNRVTSSELGGLYVTKTKPVRFYPYTGNSRYLRMRVSFESALSTEDLRKLHFVRVTKNKKK
ncbi:MAG: hypothetical protein WAO00_11015 [Chthoniobacterales bacterium]